MLDFKALPHAGIRDLSPYIPGKSIKAVQNEFHLQNIIKLASNENAFGCSPKVKTVLKNTSFEDLASYPNPGLHPCLEKLAQKLSVPKEYITFSNGTDALFGYLQICFALHNKKHILTHKYAFIAYEIQAKSLGIETKIADVNKDFTVDVNALINLCSKETALIFLANPNNPTGSYLNEKEIVHILNSIPESTILVLDEAYYEFIPLEHRINSINLLKKYPNLVITRTFSKAYGLAGLRLGYALANPDITMLLHKIFPPFTVSTLALDCALAALDDEDFVQKTVTNNIEELKKITIAIKQLNLKIISSYGNFYVLEFAEDAQKLYNELQQQGVIVRPLKPYGLPKHLRISVGTPEQNQYFLTVLKKLI